MKDNRVSRRDFVVGTGAAAVGELLAACAPKEVIVTQEVEVTKEVAVEKTVIVEKQEIVEVTAIPAPAEPVALRLLLWEQGEELNLYKDIMTNFTAPYPDIPIEVESPPGDFTVKL